MFKEIVLTAPMSDEDLMAYADLVNQQCIVWTKCTGENDTPLPVDFATEATAIAAVQVKQATLIKKFEIANGLVKGEVEGGVRGRETEGVTNITRGG